MRASLSTCVRFLARVALGLTIILIPFRYRFVLLARPQPPIYRDYTDLLLFASDIFLALTLVLWATSLAAQPRHLAAGPLFLTLPIVGMTGLGLVSAPFSVDVLLSFYHAIRLLLLAGLYMYILNEVGRLDHIALPVAIQVFVQALVGVGQVLQQHSLGLKSLDELELDPAWNGVSIVWAEGIRSLRAYGLSDHPNILGGCFALGLLMIAAWYITTGANWRAPLVSVSALGTLGLLVTFSRAAWLAFASGLIAVALLYWKARKRDALRDWLALAGAGLILVLPFLWQNTGYLGMRFDLSASVTPGTPENRSVSERSTLNSAVNTIFAENAVGGVGLGALTVAVRQRFPDLSVDYQPAHVVLLDVAAEIGILGALLYAIAMIGPWLAFWFSWRRVNLSVTVLAISGVLIAVTVIGFFDYYPWLLAPGRLWQWLVWGVWGAFYQSSLSRNPIPSMERVEFVDKEAHYV